MLRPGGPFVITCDLSGKFWREPEQHEQHGHWMDTRGAATQYLRHTRAQRAASHLRTKFQRHNRDAIRVVPLNPPPPPETGVMSPNAFEGAL